MRDPQRCGLTLIELLVAITIVAILVALLLPAVQAARESARRATCQSQMKELALACLHHERRHGHLPAGGWGMAWVGIPSRGTGQDQPGGWIFNILTEIEQSSLHELGAGCSGPDLAAANARRLQTPLAILQCPSRRSVEPYPTATHRQHLRQPRETELVLQVARSDYACNGGDRFHSSWLGPESLLEGDTVYEWPDHTTTSGLFHLRSCRRLVEIADGLSNTYLLGEKYLRTDAYDTGEDLGDDESMYSGFSADIGRYGWQTPLKDEPGRLEPLRFGSAHPHVCNMAMGDGSVQAISYTIDAETHRAYSNRYDCEQIDISSP